MRSPQTIPTPASSENHTMKALILQTAVLLLLPVVALAQNAARPRPIVSPEIEAGGKVTFRIRAAQAKEVALRGQWTRQPIALTQGEGGVWSTTVEAVPAGVWEYSFSVDGLNVLDQVNPTFKPQREPSKSILHIAGRPASAWDWQNVPHGTEIGRASCR